MVLMFVSDRLSSDLLSDLMFTTYRRKRLVCLLPTFFHTNTYPLITGTSCHTFNLFSFYDITSFDVPTPFTTRLINMWISFPLFVIFEGLYCLRWEHTLNDL